MYHSLFAYEITIVLQSRLIKKLIPSDTTDKNITVIHSELPLSGFFMHIKHIFHYSSVFFS